MSIVTVAVEGNDFRTTHEADTSDILAHHGYASDAWEKLTEMQRMGFAEDYVLYENYRRYGNSADLRADYLPLATAVAGS